MIDTSAVTIDTRRYLRVEFLDAGREFPRLDCWGLYRQIVADHTGIWLDEYTGESGGAVIRQATRSERAIGWTRIEDGEERPLDLVLMTHDFTAGDGRRFRAPGHVGCVVASGRIVHVTAAAGCREIQFRTTAAARVAETMRNAVLGIYRPEALA